MRFVHFQDELEEDVRLYLVPLIDILFLLLIFYVSVGQMQQKEAQLAVRLPTARSGENPQRVIGDVVINVREDGQVVVNSQPLDATELEERLRKLAELFPGQSVIIRSDQRARWKDVSAALDACAAADIWNIKFAVVPLEPGK
jgi:biopolymer transport protein ExbD